MNALSISANMAPPNSLANVWKRIRTWAGIKTTGNSYHTYYKVKRSFNHDVISYTNFYYKLIHTKEDCLLLATSNINFEGARYSVDEELTPFPQSDIILDWMHAVGGPAFVKHVFCVFVKDLASKTPPT